MACYNGSEVKDPVSYFFSRFSKLEILRRNKERATGDESE
jgi:hypothetical protein